MKLNKTQRATCPTTGLAHPLPAANTGQSDPTARPRHGINRRAPRRIWAPDPPQRPASMAYQQGFAAGPQG